MQKDKELAVIKSFMDKQSILDTSMTLAELTRKLGDGDGKVACYVFAWDKYVYDVASIGDDDIRQLSHQTRIERLNKANDVLNLNIKIDELMQQTRDTELAKVAGYVYTADKYTFVVNKDELDIPTKEDEFNISTK